MIRPASVYAYSPWLGLLLLVAFGQAAESDARFSDPPMPAYRVETDGFDASQADITAICDSTGRELWRLFPGCEIEPFVVERSRSGPIVLFNRNQRDEIVMRLDTHGTFWSQYAYQFAHEFCHILCGYDEDYPGNKWFEETLAETASLFAMRAMAKSWEEDPPYPNWKEYRHSLRNYADNVIAKRTRVREIYKNGLGGFYLDHKDELEKNAGLRELNGAMSLVFLRLFEEDPRRWEAVRWLNHAPSPEGETFEQYLQNWHDAVPESHQSFVALVADLYGIEITGAGETEPLVSSTPHDGTRTPAGETDAARPYNHPPMPKYRVDASGFDASVRDIRAVLDSAGRELWRFFPEHRIGPIVVVRGHSGPIVLYDQNSRGEIVIKLDTHATFWSQYAYQFSYLFANVLCEVNEESVGNKWFEVTIGEAASLFTLRAMAAAWEHDPPYAHWKDYGDSLRRYAQDVLDQREQLDAATLKDFYRKHQPELARNTVSRDVTGAMAAVLLRKLEETPEHWEAIRWLNHTPSPNDDPFGEYVQRWYDAVPKKHKPFVKWVADSYGIKVTVAEAASGESP